MKIVLRWRLVASRRHLHARNAKATATILSPSAQYLSPVHGLALHNSPALDSLLGLAQDAGDEMAPPASRLAHALFHRNTGDASEPLRPTRNRSLAAAHLCPRLQGEVLGLACRGAKLPEVREALEAAGVAALARETKVSIARFERLVSLTASAVEEDPPVGAAVFLAYVWARADGRSCLLAFLDALARHRPGLFAPDSRPRCEEWRSEWVATAFGNDVNYLLGGGSVAVAPPPAELEALLGVGAAAATGEEGEGGGEPPRAGGPSSGAPGKSDKWGPNLAKLALLSEHPTLAKAVAVASQAAAKAGDPAKSVLSEQEQTMLDGILRTAAGKPLRASPAMDVWALGMILWELFTNEPFFAGCSDDVVLQVLATTTPLDVPQSRIYDVQAQHLLMKILSKRPKERCGLSDVLKHAFLQGGLDTREVADSFAKLHDGQQNFKQALEELHPEGAQAVARHNAAEQARKQAQQQGNGAGAGAGGGAGIGPSAADPASPPPAAMQRRGSTLSDKRAQIAQRRASASPGDSLPGAAQLPDGDLRV